ncbi:MAG: hypothetical protein AAB358_00785 [Patescibacteria group bacterium]
MDIKSPKIYSKMAIINWLIILGVILSFILPFMSVYIPFISDIWIHTDAIFVAWILVGFLVVVSIFVAKLKFKLKNKLLNLGIIFLVIIFIFQFLMMLATALHADPDEFDLYEANNLIKVYKRHFNKYPDNLQQLIDKGFTPFSKDKKIEEYWPKLIYKVSSDGKSYELTNLGYGESNTNKEDNKFLQDVNSNENNADIYYRKCKIDYDNKQIKDAISNCSVSVNYLKSRAGISGNYDETDIYQLASLTLGLAYEKDGQVDRAIDSYTNGLKFVGSLNEPIPALIDNAANLLSNLNRLKLAN